MLQFLHQGIIILTAGALWELIVEWFDPLGAELQVTAATSALHKN